MNRPTGVVYTGACVGGNELRLVLVQLNRTFSALYCAAIEGVQEKLLETSTIN